MNKTIKFTIMTAWIILSRAYDAFCSVQYTPDLSHEANPLVSVLGITSWPVVLGIIAILTLYVIYTYYFKLFKKFDALPKEENLSFTNFATQYYLGRKAHWTKALYHIPKPVQRVHYILGSLMPKSLAFAGVVSTLMWLCIHYVNGYLENMHSALVIYSIIVLGSAVIAYRHFKNAYKQYQLAQSTT